MNPCPVRVLLVEDDEDDYVLTRTHLSEIQGNLFHLDWVKNYDAALETMARNQHDVYLVDYRLDGATGLGLLRKAKSQGCQGPIIVLTGQGEREVDLEAMKAGAADYLDKGRMDASLLERSIRYALERHQNREALRQAHDELERRVQERTSALEQANLALKEADRRKDEFLAMLAHELRNPLAPIRTGLHIMRVGGAKGPDIDRLIRTMEQKVQHLTRLVEDLLDVSRITRGRIQLRTETVDLATIISHAIETARPVIEAQRHQLSVCMPPEPIAMQADATRLEQVLSNLLTNAAKFTEPGGRIELSAAREDGMVAVRLRDNGIGMSAELLPVVFDMFTQADRPLARSEGGLGIGLTLVQKLVTLHGGTVTAHSGGPGKGSEFVVRLPALEPAAAKEAQGTAKITPSDDPRLRVLLVEDDETVAATMVMLLKLWGHAVHAVSDGFAALVAVRTYQPDAILLDIGLPGMNGYDVARRIRQEGGRARPLIAAVTGYGSDEDRRRSHEAGCDEHMVKPVAPSSLEAFLAHAGMFKDGAAEAQECQSLRDADHPAGV